MKKVLLGLIALIVVLVAGVAIALATIDANKYRGQIADVLSKQTGRTVTLKGPIGFGLSLHGVVITVQDAAISNPSWASRPNMAGIGHFELGVALLPLLDKQVSITEVKIENADILLETAANGKHNWDMAAQQQGTPAKAPEKPSGQSVAIQVNNVSIKDSQIGLRDKDGKTSLFKASDMTFGQEHGGIALHFAGEYNDTPIKLDLKSGASDFTSTALEALDVDLTYAAYHIKAKGTASLGGKKANITDYQVAAGASTVHGQLAADWSGAKPEVKGTLQSDKLNPADFKPAAATAAEGGSSKGVAPAASNSEFVFSDAPLPLDGLKSANAAFDVNISELVMGNGKLTNLSSKTTLNGGKLVAPVKFTLGNSPMSGEATVNAAASPAQVTLIFSAPSAELADLLKFAGAPAFLTGKANADINITSAGNTLHQMAEHANGKIDIVGGSGSISKSEAGSLSAGLMEILGGSNALNCMVARFSVAGGVMKDNGILLDTSATTVSGKGDINLGAEVLNLTLRARNKVVSAANVLPPLHVGGTFKSPSFNIDPNAMVQNVAGALMSGSLPNLADSGVPAMQSAPGQNSCVYTVEHPVAASAQQSPLNPGITGKTQKVKDIGNQLMKGLFGK